MAENRQAWLIAASYFSATLIALGGTLLLGNGGEESASGVPTPPTDQPATTAPAPTPSKEGAGLNPPASPASSPVEAVDNLLVAWAQNDRVAARRVASQSAVETFFEEPVEYRPDFFLTGCDRHRGDWTCSLGYALDDRVGYTLRIEQSDSSYWVDFAGLIVL